MQIINTLHTARPLGPSAVALGYFDGLHTGHMHVIEAAVAQKAAGLYPCVFTFTMNGRERPSAKQSAREIITPEQKNKLLEQIGVRMVLCPAFEQFQHMGAEQFVEDILGRALNAKHICCGADFRFGYKAQGDTALLATLCEQRGIRLQIIEAVMEQGRRVSSSWVREEIWAGHMENAAHLLGRAFGYAFPVVHGKQLGRSIDFPTINQPFPANFIRPKFGVYASVTLAGGQWRASVTNIGVRPTVADGDSVNSETYICGFSGDLYGRKIPVRLLKFLRPEQKFQDVPALQAQIRADAENAVPIAKQFLESTRNPAANQ